MRASRTAVGGRGPGSGRGRAWLAGRARRVGARAADPALTPDALRFQDPLEELIAEPPPRLLRGPHQFAALLLALLIGASALLRVDVVVTGGGRLVTDAPPLTLQPMERAVIREIRVRPGESVSRGQVLALLDRTFSAADRASLTGQRSGLLAQHRRIEAELAGRAAEAAPDPGDADTALQAALLMQRRSQHAARLRAYDEDIGARRAALRAIERSGAVLSQQLSLAIEVEQMRGRLLEGQVGSRLQFLGARAQRLQAEGEQRAAEGRAAELEHALRSREAERQGFVDEWERQLLEELVRVRGDLARVEEALVKATRLDELTRITAPADGVVLEVARRSAGSVLREAEPLVTMLPAGSALVAEIALGSADIGQLGVGDPVVIKVDAFPFQRHGALSGTLRSVGQESFDRTAPAVGAEPAPTGAAPAGAVHRARVVLAAAGLAGGEVLIPGMTVTAEIRVGTRSVLSYFLDPVTRGLRESLREP